MSLALCRPLVLEVALAYSTDGCDGRGVALCSCALLVVGAPVAPPPSLLMTLLTVLAGECVFVCVCSLLCICCIYRLDKHGVVYLAFFHRRNTIVFVCFV